jgi:hypothetical protein
MIIVFGGVKGGEGKSTLACNAAVIRSSKRSENKSGGESDIQPLKLRVPRDLVKDIDHLLSQRKPKISRHNWIKVFLRKVFGFQLRLHKRFLKIMPNLRK